MGKNWMRHNVLHYICAICSELNALGFYCNGITTVKIKVATETSSDLILVWLMAPGVAGGLCPLVKHLTGPALSPRPPVCCYHDRDEDLPSCLGSVCVCVCVHELGWFWPNRRASLSIENHVFPSVVILNFSDKLITCSFIGSQAK